MTSFLQTIEHLLVDREYATIPLSTEQLYPIQRNVQRSTQPFSELKHGKFRRLFDRHSITRR